jgi:hypothetical protein
MRAQVPDGAERTSDFNAWRFSVAPMMDWTDNRQSVERNGQSGLIVL